MFAGTWESYTLALTWVTATPNGVTTKAMYKVIGKTVFLNVKISATDGNGATGLNISLPIVPKTNNMLTMIPSQVAVNNSYAIKSVKIRDDGSNNDLSYNYMGTATAGQTFEANIQCCYEIS